MRKSRMSTSATRSQQLVLAVQNDELVSGAAGQSEYSDSVVCAIRSSPEG